MFSNLFSSINLHKKGLQGTTLKSQVISNNIANADTPGYKSKDINFNEVFNKYMNGKDSSDVLRRSKFTISEKKGLSIKSDGNNVDMEEEMVELNKNTMMYSVITKGLNSRLRMMKSAINEGKR